MNPDKGILRTLELLFATALLTLTFTVPALAQTAKEETAAQAPVDVTELADVDPEAVGRQGAKLLGELQSIIVATRGYKERMAGASEEDRLVLQLQIAEAEDRFMAILKELSGMVLAKGAGPEAAELRPRVEGVFVEVTPRLWEIMGELRGTIDDLRAARPEAATGDLLELEDDLRALNSRLDAFTAYGVTHLAQLEAMGKDVTADRGIFTTFLTGWSDDLSGRMSLAGERVRELGARLKETPDDADLKVRLLAAHKSLDVNATSMGVALDAMDQQSLPTGNYRAQLVTATQDLASGLLDARVAANLVRRGWSGISGWLSSEGPGFLVKILLFLVILAVGRFLARLVSRAVEKSLDRANVNMSHLLKRMTVTSSKNAIMALALVFGLAQLGISLGPLLAGFGVVGFILGFAMQDSLSNLAAGMMILVNRPYDVGDLVEISGVFGKVEKMSMVSTSVLTLDNQKLVVPNSKIWGDVIKNVTDQHVRRIDMVFGISYTDDIPHAEEVLRGILADHEKVLPDPEPVVRLHTLNDSSVDFVVRPWVHTEEYWNVYWDVTRAVKMRFDEERISIPFPQQDVHFYEQKKLAAASGSSGDVEQEPVVRSGQSEPDVNDE